MKRITTCSGIGDFIFLAQKLINQPDKFDWVIPSSKPQRAHQLATMLPQIINSMSFEDGLGYSKIKQKSYHGKWAGTPNEFYLQANTMLEEGRRVERFLPDLGTSFVLPYMTSENDRATAEEYLWEPNLKYIGIYTSSHATSQYMSGWGFKEWFELIKTLEKHTPDTKFVLLGASWDVGISEKLMAAMKPHDYINTIGQPLPVVVEILKHLDCFIGFQSGLSIINETIAAKQTVMLYHNKLERLINAWPDPARIENGSYKGCVFCDPAKVFEWLIVNQKI